LCILAKSAGNEQLVQSSRTAKA